uniref:FERM domain-containing protein n=1 Tax=Macrostomum lignano TaxID=282301 RepID=A0A1I8FSE9_9PLAT
SRARTVAAAPGGFGQTGDCPKLSEACRPSCPLHFFFHVRFWVEDVGEDLLLEATVHLFYLELSGGARRLRPGRRLRPPAGPPAARPGPAAGDRGRLRREAADHYRDLAGLGRVEAQIEMLRLSQDLEMFGLVYFPIHANGPDSDPPSWLGISCFGVSFYEQASLVKPHRRLAWSDIRRMSCRDRKFTLVANEAPSASSLARTSHRPASAARAPRRARADSKQILRLCVGNHELYMTRRMPDTIERQQMRATAREERARRLLDKQRLAKEVEGRAAAERLRGAAEEKAGQLGQQLAKLLAEKQSLAERASQFESLLLTLSEEASVNRGGAGTACGQQLAYARQGEKSLLAKLESLLRSVGVWSSAGASDSSAELQGFGALAADAETEETSGLSTAELLARLQAERQLFTDGSAAFEADLRQLRSRVQARALGGADPGRCVALPLPLPPLPPPLLCRCRSLRGDALDCRVLSALVSRQSEPVA